MTTENKSGKKPVNTRRAPKVKREAPEAAAPTKKQLHAEHKEKLSKAGKIILVVIGIAAMVLSVTAMACSGVLNQVTNKNEYELTGGVAATVNGVNIKEDTITKQIMSMRTSAYKSDEDWATFLAGQGMTPETYRENVINGYARQYLLAEAQKEENITVSQDELDAEWAKAVDSYGGDEKTFTDFLAQIGYDKTSYMESLKGSLAQNKLKEAVAPVKDATDDEVVAAINENLRTYNDARRSSHILFKVAEDATDEEKAKVEAKAQKALDKINAGEIDFADAAKKYSEDTSAPKGGDVGWDKLTTFVTEYQDALLALSVDQVSGLVKTAYGYHIIKCTDLFHVDGNLTSIDSVPKDIATTIAANLKTAAQSAAYNNWLNEYTENAKIKINKMPENVPYNVDMSKAKPAEDTGEGK